MYGIIPAAPPPDQSYGLIVREPVSHRSDGAGSFAEQLSQVSSRASEPRSQGEKVQSDAAAAKQRHDSDNQDPDASNKSGETGSTNEVNRANKDDKADTRQRDSDQSDAAKTDSVRKQEGADRAEHTDESQLPGLVEAKLQKQKRIAGSGDDQTEITAKSAVNVAKTAASDADKTHVDKTAGEEAVDSVRKVTAEGRSREKSSGAKEAQTATGEKSKVGDGLRSTDGVQPKTEPETAKVPAEYVEDKARKPSRADGAAGEPTLAENLVEQKDQSRDVDRNRRVRTGEDPREGRKVAEKVGTKTVDAKAVSPVETDNTNIERTVIRELTVDLSEGTMQQRNGGEGSENSISAARMDVGLAESPSRSPSISQATQTLARRLNGELGDNIVRQAKVMLQDANNAELRLVIRPPELGRIRIRLQMENGHIAGRILVDNGSVREVVEQNLASLQRAFEEAGLEMGDLEVSTGDAQDDAQQDDQDHGGSGQRTTIAGAESFGRSIETISEYEPGRHRINLVA